MSRKRRESSPSVKPRGDEAKVHLHHGLGKLQRAPSGGCSPIQDRTNSKAGNDRAACSLTDGAGQGAFTEELQVDISRTWTSRKGTPNCRPSCGDCGWQLQWAYGRGETARKHARSQHVPVARVSANARGRTACGHSITAHERHHATPKADVQAPVVDAGKQTFRSHVPSMRLGAN